MVRNLPIVAAFKPVTAVFADSVPNVQGSGLLPEMFLVTFAQLKLNLLGDCNTSHILCCGVF